MTRINADIPVEKLTDQHLLAEHREIKRITKGELSPNAPVHFKLGSGHVLFFRDKRGYCLERYWLIHEECKRRGFDVTDFTSNWEGLDLGEWKPPPGVRETVVQRITERILDSKMQWRFWGKPISQKEAIELLKI